MKVIKYKYINRPSWNFTQMYYSETELLEYETIMKVNEAYHKCITNRDITTVYIKG